MQNEKTDLAKAFQAARRSWGRYGPPKPAAKALVQGRAALARLPELKAVYAEARAAQEAQRAIDCRKFNPDWIRVSEAARAASKALQKAESFRYTGRVWQKGQSANYLEKAGDCSDSALYFFEDAESVFRNIQAVQDVKDSNIKAFGYYCDSEGRNTCAAFVFQGPSNNGKSRFYAGFTYTDSDSGGYSVDLGHCYESDFAAEKAIARRQISKEYWSPAMEKESYWAEESHNTARREAARAADNMARAAAEEESEYQEANQAGYLWADQLEQEKANRKEALEILAERKKLIRGAALESGLSIEAPTLCRVLQSEVFNLFRSIQKSREKRKELAAGDYEGAYFSTREERLRAAFCDGAGLSAFPE